MKQQQISKQKSLSALIFIVFIIFNLVYFFDNKNPDWEGYKSIFIDGAWLKSQGRDVGFTFLGDIVKEAGGTYTDFRIFLSTYFTVFTIGLLWIWSKEIIKPSYFLSYIGLFPLLLPRFTVQVREGIAITLVLGAYTLLMQKKNKYSATYYSISSLILSIAATYFFHSGLILLPIIIIFSILTTNIERKLNIHYGSIQNKINLLSIPIGIGIILSEELALKINLIAPELYEGFIQIETEFGTEKIFFWTLKTLILIFFIKTSTETIRENAWPPVFENIISFSTSFVLPIIQILILYIIFTSSSALIASSIMRLYNTIFFITLATVSLKSKKTLTIAIIATFQLIDQYRVIFSNIQT